MESLLGLNGTPTTNLGENYKVVPWLNWDEWDFVRLSLFSSSPHYVSIALRRISAWRSRGCLPVAIEVTASIIEIQQKDSHFRVDMSDEISDSEEMLSMLYTMAIMRLVNGVIEKTRKRTMVSIAEAAAAIDIPRMLIDIRHEGSHRELPSLRLLRLASVKALTWLKSYYWYPQKNEIPYQRGKSANVRKEIRCKLHELAFSLKVKQSSRSSSSQIKGKRAKNHDSIIAANFHGRNKFFSLMSTKTHPSKYVGSHKQLTRTMKSLVRLYSFFSSDVVSVLLEFLLKVTNSMDLVDSPDNLQINLTLDDAKAVFDEWKPVITKFSKKEPELLIGLLKAVLDMIEFRKAIRDDFGSENFSLSLYDIETERIRVLSAIFTWFLLVLKGLKPSHCKVEGNQTEAGCLVPKPTLIELMRKCLLISDPENHELLDSALVLCKMTRNDYLNEKLNKLSRCTMSSNNADGLKTEELVHQEKHILHAAKKLELIKKRKINIARCLTPKDDNVEDSCIWTIAKAWNPCPIGMLPRAVGSSGCLPVLDFRVDHDCKGTLNSSDPEELLVLGHDKTETSCDVEMMEGSHGNGERMSEVENLEFSEQVDMDMVTMPFGGLKDRLLIDGIWKKVGDQELQEIKSRVCILVNKRGA